MKEGEDLTRMAYESLEGVEKRLGAMMELLEKIRTRGVVERLSRLALEERVALLEEMVLMYLGEEVISPGRLRALQETVLERQRMSASVVSGNSKGDSRLPKEPWDKGRE